MLRKLGISLIAVALVAVMSFGAVSASAGTGGNATTSKATAKSKADKAAKQAKKACKKVKKAKGKAAKSQAKKKCKAAKKKASKLAKAAKTRTITVCAHGCDSRTLQGAFPKVIKKGVKIPASRTIIAIKPGTYVEGARVGDKLDPAYSHQWDGLTIKGTGKNPGKVIFEGKNAKDPEGNPAAQGIEAINVDDITIENLWVRNYQNNGVFIHGTPDPDFGAKAPVNGKYPKSECHNYLVKDVWASFNRSYGIYAFDCVGGRMTRTKGWGHGDSAWYIGQTPPQKKPVWSSIDHSQAYENVLGYSGTNSHYVNLHDNEVYNNGVGIVPNTLKSERYWQTSDGIIENNKIYWNNFNYFARKSSVHTVSNGLGDNPIGPGVLNYPTGVGVAIFGGKGWRIRNNDIFGNWEWGVATFSDPFTTEDGTVNTPPIGMSQGNQVTNNRMGKNGADLNGHDLFSDGSGLANCFQGNTNTVGLTFAEDPVNGYQHADLYPTCPGANIGSGVGTGDPVNQLNTLLNHVSIQPPWRQQCDWTITPHQPVSGRTPLNVELTPDPAFPADPDKSEDMALCP